MPFAVYVLGLAVFAQGTSEFMLSGLVHDIVADLRVSIPAVGSLTSAFAVGMVVGAPLVAMLSLRWPRRGALLAFLTAFLVVHVVGAVTTSFEVLFVTRVIAALANAGFLAVGLATAAGLAGPHGKGRATSVLLSGITLACIAGVPLGAVLSGFWGWRSAFWAVAAVSLPALLAILRAVPAAPVNPAAPSARHELRSLRTPRLVVTLVLGALVNGATFCTFTYLAPVITGATGLGAGWVPAVLALFGIGSFVGVTVGGMLSDTRPVPLLVVGTSALLVGWLAFVFLAANPVATLALVFVQGTLSFGVGSTLITQVLYAATDAPTLAGGFATAAFNVGAAAGPALGGVAFAMGLGGDRAPLVVSAVLVAAALMIGATAYAFSRTTEARRTPRLG
ncbi:Cmx/CmrA family chloramphenicol efflux MFS transporter [Kibdelosporangium phytohabitans]|uniref:Chemotaxis protein n=1 Tax=Kibdelosporangium phytohabitans TaxID=860235 RepID=A0A0N9IFV6_9PSEU|nr:Cmx/CmrA family chloramphenicol efflux MFS transporter [Kibdelosporangium phytohabitans]ALG15363.1 chemotaxis protein [Kibdelosporangium phytohabitans]MBE1463300.1 DHA1 family chloramphenicol resistance protein-like MFS transporter [Kibdelosporangium phytohabitans]